MSIEAEHRSDPYFRIALHEAGHCVVAAVCVPNASVGLLQFAERSEVVGAGDAWKRREEGKPSWGFVLFGTSGLPAWPKDTPRDRERWCLESGASAVATAAFAVAGRITDRLFPVDAEPISGPGFDHCAGDEQILSGLALTPKERREAERLAERILRANRRAVFAVADRLWGGRAYFLEDAAKFGIRIRVPDEVKRWAA